MYFIEKRWHLGICLLKHFYNIITTENSILLKINMNCLGVFEKDNIFITFFCYQCVINH